MQSQVMTIEINQRIHHQLPRTVIRDVATPIGLDHLHPQSREHVGRRQQVFRRAGATRHRNHRWRVFNQQHLRGGQGVRISSIQQPRANFSTRRQHLGVMPHLQRIRVGVTQSAKVDHLRAKMDILII